MAHTAMNMNLSNTGFLLMISIPSIPPGHMSVDFCLKYQTLKTVSYI